MSAPLRLFRDLLHFLPSPPDESWCDIDQCDPNRPTVVLVSGFTARAKSLNVLRRRLQREGFNVVTISMELLSFREMLDGLYHLCHRLAGTIIALHKRKGMARNRVFLVAHSAGGLVARYYIQFLGGSHYCEQLITMATPQQGTWAALFGFLSHLILNFRSLVQLLPRSNFLKELNEAPFPDNFRYVAITSQDDPMCSRGSTELPQSLQNKDNVECIEVSGLAHGEFLVSRKAHRLLSQYLKPHPTRPIRKVGA